MKLHQRPITLRAANAVVDKIHRHHKPVRGHRWSVAAYQESRLVGVAIAGRPVARGCDPEVVAEVLRLATDGTPNACSFLYGVCARMAKEWGFWKIQTYILASEPGTTLIAAGWKRVAEVEGRPWEHTAGPRRQDQPHCDKSRWEKVLNPDREPLPRSLPQIDDDIYDALILAPELEVADG